MYYIRNFKDNKLATSLWFRTFEHAADWLDLTYGSSTEDLFYISEEVKD